MPQEITGGSSGIDFILCGSGVGSAKGRVCLYLDLDIHDYLYLGGMGRVGSTIRAKSTSTNLELDLFGNSSGGYTKGVVRGKGTSDFSMEIGARGRGIVRSIVVSVSSAGGKAAFTGYEATPSRVLSPIYTTKELKILLANSGSFIPEIGMPVFNDSTITNFNRQKKIEIEVLKQYVTSDTYINDRVNWLLARVLYEGCPIMYLLNTGWQGITYPTRYILDNDRYQYMIWYLWNLMKADEGGYGDSAISGMLNDRIRIIQTPRTRLEELPKALKEIIVQLGDNLEHIDGR